ncbi:MAG: metallophosphoesterase [Desulfotomaculaceae bacterium]|nr:metallophosphoesterase [Desulfotomaculaceae bacterium]
MRVIVFSDSHGRLVHARRVLKKADRVDFMIHAGDLYQDGLQLAGEAGLPVKAVCGNCDNSTGPLEELFELAGRRILLIHGHTVNHGGWYATFLDRAGEGEIDAVIFGHTHIAEAVKQDGILLFNPGSIAIPRDQGRPSYGILEIDGEGIRPSIHRV